MWRFFGVLCLLLLPHGIDATESIRDCPANKVCVNFVKDSCANEVGGVKGSNEAQARLWTADYKELCHWRDINGIVALLDIEVLDPSTWSIGVSLWENNEDSKFEFAKSSLTFSGTREAATAKFEWGSESTNFAMKNEPTIVKTGADSTFRANVFQYSFELTAKGEPLIDLIGGSVAFKSLRDSEFANMLLADARFAKLIQERTAAVTPTTAPATEEKNSPPIGLIIGGVAGGLLLIAGLAYGIYILRRNRKRKRVIKQWSDHLNSRTCVSGGGSILQQVADTPKQGSDRKEVLDERLESVSGQVPTEDKIEEVSAAAAGASFEGVSVTGQRGDGPTESREPTASREPTPTQRDTQRESPSRKNE